MTNDTKTVPCSTIKAQKKGSNSFNEEHKEKLEQLIKAQEELRNYRNQQNETMT